MPTVGVRDAITVLVVDGCAEERNLAARSLGRRGHRVREAPSAEAALAGLDGVDVVLVAHHLPGMSGLELLARLGGRPQDPAVILLTGAGSEQVVVEALRAGAVDSLVKDPDHLSRLPDVVEQAWRRHDLARRAAQLQQLAITVTAAAHDRVLDDIVAGACSLLRADTAVLFAVDGHRLTRLALAGDEALDDGSVADEVRRRLAEPVIHLDATNAIRTLVLGLPRDPTVSTPGGALAVLTREQRVYPPAEVALAGTFGTFAGIALGHHEREARNRKLIGQHEGLADGRRHFLASLSHELRTPLTCISGFTETLIKHGDVLSGEVRRDFLLRVRSHAAELGSLVEQLLDTAAAEGAPLEAAIEAVDVSDQIRTVVDALEPMLHDRRVEIEGPPARVRGDAQLLRRALVNLVSNAVKYSPSDAPVRVSVRIEDPWVRVAVIDRGVGMTEEEVAQAFEVFWRSPQAVQSAARGTGVGLALVREYARAMAGTVDVESVPGAGSTFSISLPRWGDPPAHR